MSAKMDNVRRDSTSEKGSSEVKNTEWLPNKCRITKPPPPKPATNPLQFIKVAPCPLFQQAQEQIKKVEEIKVLRQDIKDEPEDWQQNLDNWKSSRRKRQEHIIERVVEVKKLEQEEQMRGRRKNKTFSEILKDRDKRGHRVTIPIFDDEDLNSLSDYGIGSSSSKSNSVKDVDTDDSGSLLDNKDQVSNLHSRNSVLDMSNQSQTSENEFNFVNKETPAKIIDSNDSISLISNREQIAEKINVVTSKSSFTDSSNKVFNLSELTNIVSSEKIAKDDTPQYTYEGAIEDYRSRIRSKINIDESIFTKESDCSKSKTDEMQKDIPKVDIYKRKEIFEFEKPVEISHFESNTSRRLSEAFANTQSIRDRLKSLEKCTEQPIKSVTGKGIAPTNLIKSRISNLNQTDSDNNNIQSQKDTRSKSIDGQNKSISYYLLNKSNSNSNIENQCKQNKFVKDKSIKNDYNSPLIKNDDNYSNSEAEIYMNKLNLFNRDLDTFYPKDENIISNCTEDTSSTTTTTTSASLGEFTGTLSDREDSGIHTADVSCSVSQADEPVDDTELSTTIPNCIEKLNNEKDLMRRTCNNSKQENSQSKKCSENRPTMDIKTIINITNEFLHDVRQNTDIEELYPKPIICNNNPVVMDASIEEDEEVISLLNGNNEENTAVVEPFQEKPIVFENLEIQNYGIQESVFTSINFPLAPVCIIEPPKEKPPPPPPPVDNESDKPKEANIKRLNSTKRIKKEINIKRNSFLGLDEPSDDFLDPNAKLDQPPDINSFLKRESQLEKSLYRKFQGNRDLCLSEVESQDSGLESEKGRLSSDTWCSSTPTHLRQDSEQTVSVSSEEDEISKKEREIIELVEKEEKRRDPIISPTLFRLEKSQISTSDSCTPTQYSSTYGSNTRDDGQDSEVLKVEYELLQLEREELERQRENAIFKDNRHSTFQNNRHSLENLCNVDDVSPDLTSFAANYRKSMPELQKTIESSGSYNKTVVLEPYYYGNGSTHSSNYVNDKRKSMPDVQQAYLRSIPDYHLRKSVSAINNNIFLPMEYRKSMPELPELSSNKSQVTTFNGRRPVLPPKRSTKDQRDKERSNLISRPGLHALSAVPKSRQIPSDNWMQMAKLSNETKPKNNSYNHHWLYHEAELQRLAEQNSKSKFTGKQEKHIPDPIIQTLTHRVQSRALKNDRKQITRNGPQGFSNYSSNNFAGNSSPNVFPPSVSTPLEDSQGKMLSISGKKKCSYCGNELGRGAAMIIESLCLFFHMECFKCCVCHAQLGDGLIGTDVRVRNQKLHCHNCYSSDDGVKFSCV